MNASTADAGAMRPIAERHDYGEVFKYVKNLPDTSPEKETP